MKETIITVILIASITFIAGAMYQVDKKLDSIIKSQHTELEAGQHNFLAEVDKEDILSEADASAVAHFVTFTANGATYHGEQLADFGDTVDVYVR